MQTGFVCLFFKMLVASATSSQEESAERAVPACLTGSYSGRGSVKSTPLLQFA